MDKALSNEEIIDYLKDVKIVPYSDIKNYHSINDLLAPFDKVVILYRTNHNFGHWCSIFRDRGRNEIEFFDPYGIIIDDQLGYNDNKVFQREYGQNHYYLTRLLADAKEDISYNHHKLQKFGPNINTCGRWCILRLLNTDLSLQDFKQLLDEEKKKTGAKSYDHLVTNSIKI